MEAFKCINCGDCCGPIPVTPTELKRVQKKVKSLPSSVVEKLKKQKRDALTCIFLDTESKKCSIYSARPELCKMFGFYKGMVCGVGNNSLHATIDKKEGMKHLERVHKGERPIGILSMSITWDNLLKIKIKK